MDYVIKAYSLDLGKLYGYVSAFDPDHPVPHGTIEFTDDPEKALRYESPLAALQRWKTQSSTHPIRETDGGENRPMTAFSVEVLTLAEAALIVRERLH